MACNGFYATFNGERVCIPIYVIEHKWPPKDPDPGPWRDLFTDVSILKTINEGVARISDQRLRQTLGDAVQSAARSMTLPKGLELGDGLFKGQRVMETAE